MQTTNGLLEFVLVVMATALFAASPATQSSSSKQVRLFSAHSAVKHHETFRPFQGVYQGNCSQLEPKSCIDLEKARFRRILHPRPV
jgi:hypothetical protein